jgi:hypothetical protein
MFKEKIRNPLNKTKIIVAQSFVICTRSFNINMALVNKSYSREWDISYKYKYTQGLRICLRKLK